MAGDGKDNKDEGTFQRVAPYIAPGIGIIGGIAATAAGAPMVGVPLLTAGAAGAGAQAVKDFGGGAKDDPHQPPSLRAMDDSIATVWKARRALENNDTERAKALLDEVLNAPTVKEALKRAGKEG